MISSRRLRKTGAIQSYALDNSISYVSGKSSRLGILKNIELKGSYMNWLPKPSPGHYVDKAISSEQWADIEVHGEVEIEGIDFEGFLNLWRAEGGEPIRVNARELWVLLSRHFGEKDHNPFEEEVSERE